MQRVSIITIAYNSVTTIQDTIESVLDQDYPYIEYILIDGASTDGTVDIIKSYSDRIAHVISEPDRGMYDALNKGLALATGDIIGMLNSDDFYIHPQVISTVVTTLQNTQTDCVFADMVYVNPTNLNKKVVRY